MSREEYNELTNWPSDKGSRTGILCNVVRNDLELWDWLQTIDKGIDKTARKEIHFPFY